MSNLDNMGELFGIAWQSLMLHKLRSGLSILGIVCGVMAVLTMIAAGEGAKHELLQQIEKLGARNIYIRARDMTETQKNEASQRLSAGLRRNDAERILRSVPRISEVATLKEVKAALLGKAPDITPQVTAVSGSYAEVMGISVASGRFINGLDIQAENMVCVLGDSVAESLGIEGRIGSYMRIENHLFKVVGRLHGYRKNAEDAQKTVVAVRDYNEMLFIPAGLENLFATGAKETAPGDAITEMIIQVKNSNHVFQTAAAVERMMDRIHNGVSDYLVIVPQGLLRQAQQTQKTFNMVLGAIAGISLLVGGIGIMNVMLVSVSERTREIGLRRAVGATRIDIVQLFLTQSVILTLSGGLAGVLGGTAAAIAIARLAEWQTRITLWSVAAPVAMSIIVGIFFGLFPAVQASRLDPIAALRHE